MIRETLTMIPGPTPVHDAILDALGRPTVSHQDPAFVADFRRCLERTGEVVRGPSARPFVVGGAGTLAMEMALVNLLGPGDRLLVVTQGYFGDRFRQVADAFGIAHDALDCPWGQAVPPERVREALADGGHAALAMTHVDTSTGVAAPVEEYAAIAREHGALAILDGVCATAGMDERFDAWGLDALLTGAQKALGAPPGVAVLVVSDRALARREALERVPAYYADLKRWMPVMENPALYFSTPPVNEIRALDAALGLVLEEGLDARFDRHRRVARAVRAGLGALGLELFTAEGCRADTLSVPLYPDGVVDADFRAAAAARGVVFAGALGPVAGKAFRIGHMGNVGPEEVARALDAIEGALADCGHGEARGRALAAAAEHF